MADESPSDDPGTILDSYVSQPRKFPFRAPMARQPVRVEEVLYQSPYRWKTPRILVCDDNSLDEGEVIYVRSDRVVIGRTKGDIVIGHDAAMSGAHAEISRKDFGGQQAWILRDLDSSNGTLVRAKTVTLRPGMSLLIGAKRYRFDQPLIVPGPADGQEEAATMLLTDLSCLSTDALPALVEGGGTGGKEVRYPFRATRVRLGRPGLGNEIEIDDLCLAGTHAIISRDYSGAWQLEAPRSLNGVWVKVDQVKLIHNSLFQCGEQRFRFQE